MASEKITKLMDDVKSLTVLELNELVKAAEEKLAELQDKLDAFAYSLYGIQ